MSATHHIDAPEEESEWENQFGDDVVAEFATLVETCLAHREDVQSVLTEIRQAKLQGEPVQERLETVLEEEPTLRVAGVAAYNDELGDLLEAAETAGALSDADVEAFETFWARNQWITPGVVAYRKGKNHGSSYWTNADLECRRRDGLLYVRHQFEWGLDQVHDVEAPLDAAWQDLLARLRAVLVKLAEDDVALTAKEKEILKQAQPVLEQVHGQLDDLDVQDAADGANGSGDQSGAGSLASLFDDGEGGETEDEDDDEVDESLIGFA